MAEISDIPYDTLLDVYQSRVRLQTLKKANDIIGDDIAQMPIFPYYSLDMAILYGGVDGQKFEVERSTLKARRSRKYFKKGKGVVAYRPPVTVGVNWPFYLPTTPILTSILFQYLH